MTLSVHVQNVDHGDSIILEYTNEGVRSFGLIDCGSRNGSAGAKTIQKLQSLGATELSFILLTHPHSDHYHGMLEVMEAFTIKQFLSFPLDKDLSTPKRLEKLAEIYAKLIEKTDSPSKQAILTEFLKILVHAKNTIGLGNMEQPEGLENRLFTTGFTTDIEVFCILPLKSQKGSYFHALDEEKLQFAESRHVNDLSVCLMIRYKGHEIILGADATEHCVADAKRRRGHQPWAADVVKLPHHGSKTDCSKDVLETLFTGSGERIAIISASGKSHPHPDTLRELEKMGIQPYCTNLATCCADKIKDFLSFPEYDAVLSRLLATNMLPSAATISPCQGDICVTIDASGALSVSTEHGAFCAYRSGATLFPTAPTTNLAAPPAANAPTIIAPVPTGPNP